MKSYEVAAVRFAGKEVVDMNSFVQASREEIEMLRALLSTTVAYFGEHAPKDMIEALDQFIGEVIKPIGKDIDALYRKSIGE